MMSRTDQQVKNLKTTTWMRAWTLPQKYVPSHSVTSVSNPVTVEAVIFTKTTSRARSEDPDPCDENEEGDLARRLASRRKAAPHIRMSSESSSSTNNDAPPTSDMSDVDEPDPAHDAAASSTHHHRRHSQTAKKVSLITRFTTCECMR